jgi:tetratricopeptide (TPR) repeat protein
MRKGLLFFIIVLSNFVLFGQTENDYVESGKRKLENNYYIQGAIADFNKAFELNPKNTNALFYRGVTKARLKDYRGAIMDYNKVIEIDSDDCEAHINRGAAKSQLKDFNGAIIDYNKAIRLNPKKGMAYYNRGLDKIAMNQNDSGCSDLSKAGELGFYKAYEAIQKYCNN